MGTNCTNPWNEIKMIGLSHSADITRCLCPPILSRNPPSGSQFSSVGNASQNHCLSSRPLSPDNNEAREIGNHSME